MLGRMLQATHYLHAVGVVSSPSHHEILTYTFVWAGDGGGRSRGHLDGGSCSISKQQMVQSTTSSFLHPRPPPVLLPPMVNCRQRLCISRLRGGVLEQDIVA